MLSKEERLAYYKHLDNMRSLTSMVESAWENGEWEGLKKGRAEGMNEERIKIAFKLLDMGIDVKSVSDATGLAEAEIEGLRRK